MYLFASIHDVMAHPANNLNCIVLYLNTIVSFLFNRNKQLNKRFNYRLDYLLWGLIWSGKIILRMQFNAKTRASLMSQTLSITYMLWQMSFSFVMNWRKMIS